MNRARYIMIGGFLGAGKSTSVARLAHRLTNEGLRVGLITNDQGSDLVDTSTLRSQGFAVEEIAGGCFCCRFDSLRSAAQLLDETTRPQVFIAEPVGSCTDLVATVSYPLRRIYGDAYRIAPLSVLVDPIRALRVLELEPGRKFSEKVRYVYKKQLEEANFIVINKCDLLDEDRLQLLREGLEKHYPQAEIFEISARSGEGTDAWFDRIIAQEIDETRNLEIDYDVYADGEALLGWLNATLKVEASTAIDGNRLLLDLANSFHRGLEAGDSEVAHLKMTLSPHVSKQDAALSGSMGGEIGVINLVRMEQKPEMSHTLPEPVLRGQIIVNLRAEASPSSLRDTLESALTENRTEGIDLQLDHVEFFQPGRPEPTHRLTASRGESPTTTHQESPN